MLILGCEFLQSFDHDLLDVLLPVLALPGEQLVNSPIFCAQELVRVEPEEVKISFAHRAQLNFDFLDDVLDIDKSFAQLLKIVCIDVVDDTTCFAAEI